MIPSTSKSLSPVDGTIAGGGSNAVDRPISKSGSIEEERNEEFKYELEGSIRSAIDAGSGERSEFLWEEAKRIAYEWIEYSKDDGISAETKKMARAGFFELVEKYVGSSTPTTYYDRLCDAVGMCGILKHLQGLDEADPEWKKYDAAFWRFTVYKYFAGRWRQRSVWRLKSLKHSLERIISLIPNGPEYEALRRIASELPKAYDSAIEDRLMKERGEGASPLPETRDLVTEKRDELEATLAFSRGYASEDVGAIKSNYPSELDYLKALLVEAIEEAKMMKVAGGTSNSHVSEKKIDDYFAERLEEETIKGDWDAAKILADRWMEYSDMATARTKERARGAYFKVAKGIVENAPEIEQPKRLRESIRMCSALLYEQGLAPTDPEWKKYDVARIEYTLRLLSLRNIWSLTILQLEAVRNDFEKFVLTIPNSNEYAGILKEVDSKWKIPFVQALAEAKAAREELVRKEREKLEAILADEANLSLHDADTITTDCPTELYELCLQVAEAIRTAEFSEDK